jgi:heme exporter protein B
MGGTLHSSFTLLRMYWALEGRNRQVLSSVILYVLVIVLVSGYIFQEPETLTWLALYWMILLFAAVNAGVLSFVQEAGGRRWYYYQLADPFSVFIAKSVHLFFLIMLVALLTGSMLALRYTLPDLNVGTLMAATSLACAGLAMLFAFMSGAASQAAHSATLTTIIGFPLVIGICMLAGKIAASSLMQGLDADAMKWDYLMLIGLDLLIGGMGMLLFAYIWRD